MKLSGRTALITGAGTGFGAAMAATFAAEGAAVAVNYPTEREAADANAVVDSICAAGGTAIAVRGDVSDWQSVADMVAGIVERFGRIDILVNNAAVNSHTPLHDVTLEQWNRTIAVSLTGVFICIRQVLPHMLAQARGNIVNIASIAPWYAGPTVDYNAAKAGVIAIGRTVARHYGRAGIRCNTIAPGFHRTAQAEAAARKVPISFLDNIPVGFAPGAEDLAKVALFLASEDSRYVHGHTLVSDGGIVMR